jgi:rhodanese-related sulfurtransferase
MKLAKILMIASSILVAFGTAPVIAQDSVDPNDLLTIIDVNTYDVIGAEKIDVYQAKDLFDAGVVFIDPRDDEFHQYGFIPGSIHLHVIDNFTKENLALYADFNDTIVIYGEYYAGYKPAQASAKAVAWGYTDVKYFERGYDAWVEAGFAVEKDN